MEKRISFDQFQSAKRVAQACNPLMVKRDKIRAKIEALQAEYENYDTQISSLEAGIKQVVGFRVEELVKKVIEPGIDVNGQPKKTTKYLPTGIVSYDEEKKQFVISLPESSVPASSQTPSSFNDVSTSLNNTPIKEELPAGSIPVREESSCNDVSTSLDNTPKESDNSIF